MDKSNKIILALLGSMVVFIGTAILVMIFPSISYSPNVFPLTEKIHMPYTSLIILSSGLFMMGTAIYTFTIIQIDRYREWRKNKKISEVKK